MLPISDRDALARAGARFGLEAARFRALKNRWVSAPGLAAGGGFPWSQRPSGSTEFLFGLLVFRGSFR